MSQTRRLSAILAADVAGYSRLMGADEEGTHERLQVHLRELVNPKIGEHRGRIVKNTGDGLLAEFGSVVDAVRYAVQMQREMAERNADVPPDRRIEFRIGINLGDVIVEPHDIFGDGVNVAARLETLAEPGGICVSRVVRDQVRDKLDFAFEDRGEQTVKNIVRPVRVYAWRPEPIADLPAATVSRATSVSQPIVAPRLSIVVLPFTNLSNDPEQQYFADGITEDLTTDLSRIAGMLVISRNTAFTYRGKSVDTKQIGRELAVRYVLEGSVRRLGNQVRVNAQLIEAETDAHLWAERFDGNASDLLALQDEMASRIAVALDLEMVDAEAARSIEHPGTQDYILRGRAVRLKPTSHEYRAEAIRLFERALALDPHSVAAQSWLAIALMARVLDNMANKAAADIRCAERLAERALVGSPRSSFAHFAKAQVFRAQDRYDEAILEYETAIAFNRNWADAYSHLGWCKFMTGLIEELIPAQERAIRLSPHDPQIGLFYGRIGHAHLLQSRNDAAIIWYEKARNANPAHAAVRTFLASAYALEGRIERAALELAEARRLSDGRYSSIARLKASGISWGSSGYWGISKMRALFETTYFVGLRKAGMPEE
jgi:TolB-like protein/class 3 adenylate cyclase/cytochrome c-type biogenesis protein CcmH/NrfG